MIKFDIDGKTVLINREDFEARLQDAIIQRFEESKEVAPVLRSGMKMIADMILPMVGLKVPKGEDKLAYLTAYIMKAALDYMEGTKFVVNGQILDPANLVPFEPEEKEVMDNAD